jgi:hypothetical protein
MLPNEDIHKFLLPYYGTEVNNTLVLRQRLLHLLPDITEQIDLPAKMICYCYGQKYSELICVIIPSKKGLKLGFNRGTAINDPRGLLQGSGKISRYVPITSEEQINGEALNYLITCALNLYRQTVDNKKKILPLPWEQHSVISFNPAGSDVV